MIKGYNDEGGRIKIVHWPLKSLWRCRNERRDLSDRGEDGKQASGFAGIRWPYSRCSANGWNPFTGKQETPHRISRKYIQTARARRMRKRESS